MSIASRFVLVLVLCLSFYSCKARSLGVAAKEVEVSKNKKHDDDHEKLNPDRVSSTKPESKSSVQEAVTAFEEEKEEGRSEENKIDDPRTDHDADSNGNQVEVSSSAAASKKDHDDQSQESSPVTWRVPHEKRSGDEPGFNLDYLPPRTHPPAHN